MASEASEVSAESATPMVPYPAFRESSTLLWSSLKTKASCRYLEGGSSVRWTLAAQDRPSSSGTLSHLRLAMKLMLTLSEKDKASLKLSEESKLE